MASTLVMTPGTPGGGDAQALLANDGAGPGIHLLPGFQFPVTVSESTWAESKGTEGRRRTRTRPLNPTGGGQVRVEGATGAAFWDYVDDFQQTVAAMNLYGGEIAYTPHDGDLTTFVVESCDLTPDTNLDRLTHVRHAILGFTFECQPFGLLTWETVI